MLRSLLQVLFGIFFLGWLVEEKEERPPKDATVRSKKFEMLHRYVVGRLLSSLSWNKSVAVRRGMELLKA